MTIDTDCNSSTLSAVMPSLDFIETSQFSDIFLDFVAARPALQDFYAQPPTIEGFAHQIKSKASFDPQKREVLVQTLKSQYKNISNIENSLQISKLKNSHTFTVTTGHQLNAYTGPLYFHYKILSCIKTCEILQKQYPDYDFVPIYWMASEDHDLEEIAEFRLFGKTLQWQTHQKGAVGRMSPEGLADLLADFKETAPLLEEAYRQNTTLADAMREIVDALYGKYGLLVLDADTAALKAKFTPYIQRELQSQVSEKSVLKSNQKLDALGYKTQVTPRNINLFYMDKDLRARIERNQDGSFQVVDTDLRFEAEELIELLQSQPERFSPNVVLRPLYQEVILPNLGYVGGPGELAYWLQLKAMFEDFEVPYPILMPRNFRLILNTATAERIEKLGLSHADLFKDSDTLRIDYVKRQADNDIHLQNEQEEIANFYARLADKVENIDASLKNKVAAEAQKTAKSLANLETKLRKAEERNHETAIRQIYKIKAQLFPDGNPQERIDNFMNFWLNSPCFLADLHKHTAPFDFKFQILRTL
ncbi:MAG: bacillithiol biosynthesis cysteine-adding enzyme BshC [Bernardetiaceae bacterium]|nr:bacillithiol biosynthesis cysteine-adding enzyme BshC [Bernardetiaceae bacterium]